MFRLLWALSSRIYYFLRPFMPTNILIDMMVVRRGLRSARPALLIAAAYLLAVTICGIFIANGAPGWLYLLVFLFIWNARKFIALGATCLVRLSRIRIQDAAERRRVRRQNDAMKSADYATIGS